MSFKSVFACLFTMSHVSGLSSRVGRFAIPNSSAYGWISAGIILALTTLALVVEQWLQTVRKNPKESMYRFLDHALKMVLKYYHGLI